jgi:hypothetical protein
MILGLDVRLTSTVKVAGGKTRVVLSKAHSKSISDPTAKRGGLTVFCLGWIIDRWLTGLRGSMIELGPMGMPGPPMMVPEPGLPSGGRAVGCGGGVPPPEAEAVDAGWEAPDIDEKEGEVGCAAEEAGGAGGFGEGFPGFCCCRAKSRRSSASDFVCQCNALMKGPMVSLVVFILFTKEAMGFRFRRSDDRQEGCEEDQGEESEPS